MSEAFTLDNLLDDFALTLDQLRGSVTPELLREATELCAKRCPNLAALPLDGQHELLTNAEKHMNVIARDAESAVPAVAYSILTGYHGRILDAHREWNHYNGIQRMNVHYFALANDFNTPHQYEMPLEGFHNKAGAHAAQALSICRAIIKPSQTFKVHLLGKAADIRHYAHRLRGNMHFWLLDEMMTYLRQADTLLAQDRRDLLQMTHIVRNVEQWVNLQESPNYAPYVRPLRDLHEKWRGMLRSGRDAPQDSTAPDKKAL